jgi:TfoX/Sxy family transcriptional regulator of competence genes
MSWIKAPTSLVELFADSLPADAAVERRRMFGYPAAFVQGNMFAGVFQDQVFARVSPADRAALEERYGSLLFAPMAGRPMKDYLLAPDDIVAEEADLADLLAKAFAYTRTLPPKEKLKRAPGASGRKPA